MAGYCGIDFGTSNSALAAGTKNGVNLVRLERKEGGGQVTIPTAVFFNQDTHRIAFGRNAVAQYLDGHEGRFMRALKSILGSSLMGETTQIGRERKDFSSIIGLFVAHIKSVAETELGHALTQVVMGRPVRFNDHDDAADRRAESELRAIARAQGFQDIEFEYEPLAAARDYESRLEKEELVLVADIGGGTSDFSVIRVSPEARHRSDRSGDILANAGIHIGGTDFDKRFSLSAVMPALGYRSRLLNGLDVPSSYYHTLSTWHLINQLYVKKMRDEIKTLPRDAEEPGLVQRLIATVEHQRGHELASVVEAAKIALSDRAATTIDATFIDKGLLFDVRAADLTAAVENDIRAVAQVALDTVVQKAGVAPARIDTIFLTGGSTALPGFEDAIRSVFPESKLNYGDRFSSVVAGLGLKARQSFGE
jgi:hypothetical chaperone protein